MGSDHYLSQDGQTVLALCSAFGLPADAAERGVAPLRLSEWNELARQIESSSWKRPSALHGRTAAELSGELSIPGPEAERLERLLERSSGLTLELQNAFERGLWAVTRVDEAYPAHLLRTLKTQAPVVLFGAGNQDLLRRPGVAVVGSRNIDEAGARFARQVGAKAVAAGLPVVSGGARGTDRIAMDGALEADGTAIGVMADSLEATARKSDVRQFLLDERLLLLTPYAPTAGFSIGAAMGRNKVIYGLAEYAVIVNSEFQTGGTWAGAVEALKANWCPTFVRDAAEAGKGNRELVKVGAAPLSEAELAAIEHLGEWMGKHARRPPQERELFDL